MHTSRGVLAIAVVVSLSVIGTLSAEPPKPADSVKSVETAFNKDLLKAATEYKSWGRVDDETRWAPELCRLPNPGRTYVSASKDEDTHGQKLYSLFARHRSDYVALPKTKTSAVGQTIVKQSWIPEEITDSKLQPTKGIDRTKVVASKNPDPSGKPSSPFSDSEHFYPYVWKGDKVFKATKQADLFIMMKLDPQTPDTDNGWVYATVTSDGKTVTAAGKIESCMKCHNEAKTDRLFGLTK